MAKSDPRFDSFFEEERAKRREENLTDEIEIEEDADEVDEDDYSEEDDGM